MIDRIRMPPFIRPLNPMLIKCTVLCKISMILVTYLPSNHPKNPHTAPLRNHPLVSRRREKVRHTVDVRRNDSWQRRCGRITNEASYTSWWAVLWTEWGGVIITVTRCMKSLLFVFRVAMIKNV